MDQKYYRRGLHGVRATRRAAAAMPSVQAASSTAARFVRGSNRKIVPPTRQPRRFRAEQAGVWAMRGHVRGPGSRAERSRSGLGHLARWRSADGPGSARATTRQRLRGLASRHYALAERMAFWSQARRAMEDRLSAVGRIALVVVRKRVVLMGDDPTAALLAQAERQSQAVLRPIGELSLSSAA